MNEANNFTNDIDDTSEDGNSSTSIDLAIPRSGHDRFLVFVLLVLSVVSVTANTSLLVVVLRVPGLRQRQCLLLVLSLSCADLLISVIHMPSSAFHLLLRSRAPSPDACAYQGFLAMLALISSVLHLAVISMNRYMHVCRNKLYRVFFTKRRVKIMAFSVWFLSAILALPPLVGWSRTIYYKDLAICFPDWTYSISYTVFFYTTCFLGPLVVMIVCSVRIVLMYRVCRFQFQVTLQKISVVSPESPAGPHGTAAVKPKFSIFNIISNNLNLTFESSEESEFELRDDHDTDGYPHTDVVAHVAGVAEIVGKDSIDRSSIERSSIDRSSIDRSLSTPPSVQSNTECLGLSVVKSVHSVIKVLKENSLYDFADKSERCSSDGVSEPMHKTLEPLSSEEDRSSLKRENYVHTVEKELEKPPKEQKEKDINIMTRRMSDGQTAWLRIHRLRQEEKRLRQKAGQFQLALSLVLAVGSFVFCWMPFFITRLLLLTGVQNVQGLWDMSTLLLGYCNSCANPIIYGVCNRHIRLAYINLYHSVRHYYPTMRSSERHRDP